MIIYIEKSYVVISAGLRGWAVVLDRFACLGKVGDDCSCLYGWNLLSRVNWTRLCANLLHPRGFSATSALMAPSAPAITDSPFSSELDLLFGDM